MQCNSQESPEEMITDIGQLTPQELCALQVRVKKGELIRGRTYKYPTPKTAYVPVGMCPINFIPDV